MKATYKQQTMIASTFATGLPQGETFNTISHLVGSAVCFCIALALCLKALSSARQVQTVGLATYALTASVGFFCSALFHAAPASHRARLRRYDRAAIHLALGGFHFANISAVMPDHAWLASLPIWSLLIHLIRREMTDTREKRNIFLYLLAGWGGCLVWVPLISKLPSTVLGLETCGALAITLGAIAYRSDNLPKNHQIWHFLVLLGSLCQIAALAGVVLS